MSSNSERTELLNCKVEPCPYIAATCVTEKTGPLPPVLFAAASYALYLCSTLYGIRQMLDAGIQISDDSDSRELSTVAKLRVSFLTGQPLIKQLSPEFIKVRNQSFRFPHCAAASAHLAAVQLGRHAYVVLDRSKPKNPSSQIGLDLDGYRQLEREIVEEACWLAEKWKDEDDPDSEPYLGIVLGDREAIRVVDDLERTSEFGKCEKPWQLFRGLVLARERGVDTTDLNDEFGTSLYHHKAKVLKIIMNDLQLDIGGGKTWVLKPLR